MSSKRQKRKISRRVPELLPNNGFHWGGSIYKLLLISFSALIGIVLLMVFLFWQLDRYISQSGGSFPSAEVLLSVGAFVSILAIIAVGIIVAKQVSKPIRRLKRALASFGEGVHSRVPLPEGPEELRDVLQTFNEMADKVEAAEEQQKRMMVQRQKMMADISHDLKTPITVIQGYIDAINDGLIPPDQQKKYLSIIAKKAELLSTLINHFSDYSKLEHPDFHLNQDRGDLCEYLRGYVAEKYEELEMQGFRVNVEIPECRMMSSYDSNQLKRVFENIILNSMKHTKPGTEILVGITELPSDSLGYRRGPNSEGLQVMKRSSSALIVIGDTGEGIPEEYRSTIFDPFVMGDASRTGGKGSGLGLSIAKKIVEAHGGRISLADEGIKKRLSKRFTQIKMPVKGCVFAIILPLRERLA
jgi:signal transduction histidine kinase